MNKMNLKMSSESWPLCLDLTVCNANRHTIAIILFKFAVYRTRINQRRYTLSAKVIKYLESTMEITIFHIFKCIFLNKNDKILIQISLKFVPKSHVTISGTRRRRVKLSMQYICMYFIFIKFKCKTRHQPQSSHLGSLEDRAPADFI